MRTTRFDPTPPDGHGHPVPVTALPGGVAMPMLGVGTWPLDDAEVVDPVLQALDLGYRAVDTAEKYGNQVGVGRALAQSGVPRDEIFVTTKLDGRRQGAGRAHDGIAVCLDLLGLDYVDLLLIHWPLPARDLYCDTWRTFVEIRERGLARAIGVSNFSPAHLERLIDETGVTPDLDQLEINPYVGRRAEREAHRRWGIVTSSWSPLGAGNGLVDDPVIRGIADEAGCTPAQAVLAWHRAHGFPTMPKSTRRDRLAENLASLHVQLDDAQIARIDALDRDPGVDPETFGH